MRTHVRGDEHLTQLRAGVQLRVNRVVRQLDFRRLGDAEFNHLGHGHTVVQRDEDVRRLDDLERDAMPHWLSLLRDIHHAAAAFTDMFQKFVTSERLPTASSGASVRASLIMGRRSPTD
ncbi:MAG: hypothetical protein EXS36_02495 [Pedosphaera sp.]|nr:hypothetical protein [Pedosphaera sp.]